MGLNDSRTQGECWIGQVIVKLEVKVLLAK